MIIMETLILKVKGMTCDHCERTVTKALNTVTGVKKASIDRANEIAEVTYKRSKIEPKQLIEAVKEVGYEASLE